MNRALLAVAVDPGIGGVLVTGDRGTGKSTAVRALAALLPDMATFRGCRFNCDPARVGATCVDGTRHGRRCSCAVPMVDLPLGSTEDRLLGALDLEAALNRGERRFDPGLLARAHRGFLYVDEINLLDDTLVDLLLDVAASGENLVEREGLSVRHPARITIVGSANPEEGELRPQLLDRFGLCVEVRTPTALPERIEVVRRRDRFDRDPAGFAAASAPAQAVLRERLARARAVLPEVSVPDPVLERAAALCLALNTDGLRGELTLMRAARALAALDGERVVTATLLDALAPSVLRHRLRRDPLDESGSTVRIERALLALG
ncbi:MAG: ATP-binding protein [Gluconacetobacter diazotrophicus]|nr:ATP-binding protein [Gluconacetobacter diazotrophicus]